MKIHNLKWKNVRSGNTVKIDDSFKRILTIQHSPYTGQVFVTYAGNQFKRCNGYNARLRRVAEFHEDDYTQRYRNI